MADKWTLVLVFASLGVVHVPAAEEFIFEEPKYILDETSGVDNVQMVRILRSGTTAETNLATQITLSTACPLGIQATATFESDYTAPTTVNFDAGNLFKDIEVTIIDDLLEEFREFFCLTITTNAGSENTIQIYIPGSDYCIHTYSPAASSVDAVQPADPSCIYVGPWLPADPDIHDTFDIDILPESASDGGDGEELNIFLRDVADQSVLGNFYGLQLDITDPLDDPFNADGVAVEDSIVVRNYNLVDILNDNDVDNIDMVATGGSKFTVQYTESNGQIVLTDRGNGYEYNAADDSGTPIGVSHVFVSSGNNDDASWTVCGMLPRRLAAVSTSASGYEVGSDPNKATDNDRNVVGNVPNAGCFISDPAVDPWLQVDLGREFDVKMVLLWPVTSDGTTANPDWLDNADVYVGSCPATSSATLTSNNVCDNDIGVVGVKTVIAVECQSNAYGRYVYVHQDTSSAERLAICEVEVYGDDIPIGDETMVEFATSLFETANDESATSVTISITRTGTAPTCTSVDFYTDATGVINGGDADFTPVLSTDPVTITWDDTSSSTQTHTVAIYNDDECESMESFNVFLTNVDGGVLGTQSSATASIIDDDSVTYTLTMSAYSDAEGSSIRIGVSRSGAGIMQAGTAELTFTDVTAQATDYGNTPALVPFTSSSSNTQYHMVSTADDMEYEGDETFTVTISTLQPSTCSSLGATRTATVTVTDNDSKYTWDTSDDTIRIPEGTSTTVLMITRVGLVQARSVNINVDEVSADSSTDFSVSASSAYFGVGDPSESITITVKDDSIVEGDESFTLILEDPTYTTGHRNLYGTYRVTIVIQDNDAKYTWKQSAYTTPESSGLLEVCLLRSGDTSTTKHVEINSVSGTATSGADFNQLTQIMFAATTTEACGDVTIINDNEVENTPQTFTLSILQGQQDVAIGARQTTQVTITDDDSTVSWEQAEYYFGESSTTNVVKIIKTGNGSPTITITSQQVSATQGVDYAPVSSTVTLSNTKNDFTITIYGDETDEPSETFTLILSGASAGASVTSIATTTIIIIDDDPTPPSTPPPPADGLSPGAIVAILVAALVGAIIFVIAAILGYMCFAGRCIGASAKAPARAVEGFQGYPLTVYGQQAAWTNFGGNALGGNSFGGNSFAIDNGFGSFPNQQFGGFNQQQALGFP